MTNKRKKYHEKRWRARNRKRDLDEIDVDQKKGYTTKLLNQDVDLDLSCAAQHYCFHCARYFIDEKALTEHFKTKIHKRILKALDFEPYGIKESELVANLGSFKLPTKIKIVTQNSDNIDVIDQDGDCVLQEVSPNKERK